MIKRLLKEPLIHFILLGFGLFVLYGLVGQSDRGNKIVIDEYDLNAIISKWKLQWQREPSHEELKGLLDAYIKEEIYYREALAMNLDHNDEIIRRRLAKKIKFLTQDVAENTVPDDEALQHYFETHRNNYLREKRIGFQQIFFSPDHREDSEGDARKALSGKLPISGDPSPVRQEFDDVALSRIRADLGLDFANSINGLDISEQWQGPVRSGLGYHLLLISDISPPQPYELEEIRAKVITDYQFDFQNRINEELYRSLLEKYEVIIDLDEDFQLQNPAE